jgi:hypothetical protein
MAGYVGTKAVLLSTTAATVGGDADIGGALDVGGAFTSQGIDDNANATAITIDSSENVGIGGIAASNSKLHVFDSTASVDDYTIHIESYTPALIFQDISGGPAIDFGIQVDGSAMMFRYGDASSGSQLASEAMRIDASGNLLVGGSTTNHQDGSSQEQFSYMRGSFLAVSRSQGTVAYFNRQSTDGDIVQFRKNGSTVGSIGVGGSSAQPIIGSGNTGSGGTAAGLRFDRANNSIQPWNVVTNASADNIIDLGFSSIRFDDIYATNGTIQTSDRNDKQDIRDLTEAEQRVAVACKGLLKAWRWKSAVEEKGDDARIHCGIIAQDLQAAFAAEGLDAGRYAMFMSNTWWEHDVEVPAVEAVAEVLDEDGNVVTEAVEAVDAYTRTDTYDTQEEAPEGATERTRLGVRYSELLAFIIGAL